MATASQKNVTDIKQKLREGGHRITDARGELIELLAASKSPLSAQDLIEALDKRKQSVNKTTVYRELDFLEEQSVIRELDLMDGKKRYELLLPEDHHHHLVCTKCRQIQCVELPKDLEEIEQRIQRQYKFKIQSHILEFFGLCADCK